MTAPIPEGQGEAETTELDYELSFDPETNTSGVLIRGKGCEIGMAISLEGITHAETMAAAFLQALPQLLEAVLEAQEAERG